MKTDTLKKRLRKDRPLTSITLNIPEDVFDDLKKIAPIKGVGSVEALIRLYIGRCLREDLELIDNLDIEPIVKSMRQNGLDDQLIANIMYEAQGTDKFEKSKEMAV